MKNFVCLLSLLLFGSVSALCQGDTTSSRKLRIRAEIGLPVASQFIDKTYQYNYSNNNTLGGLGGIKVGLILNEAYKIQFAQHNLDETIIASGDQENRLITKDLNRIITVSRILSLNHVRLDFGLSYLYVSEYSRYPPRRGRPSITFSSSDHYLGGHFGCQYLINHTFGPYVNYSLVPFRLSNQGAFGYNHNVSLGLVVLL